MKSLGMTAAALILVAACSSTELYKQDNYGEIDVQQHQYAGKTFNIRDNREADRLFIALGYLSSLPEAFPGSPTIGGPETVYRSAALNYLRRSTGRSCEIVDGALLFEAEYEYFYPC